MQDVNTVLKIQFWRHYGLVEMVEHKIRLLTSAISHIGHVDNVAEERTGSTCISRKYLSISTRIGFLGHKMVVFVSKYKLYVI